MSNLHHRSRERSGDAKVTLFELSVRIEEGKVAIADACEECKDWSDPSSGRTACNCVVKRIKARLDIYQKNLDTRVAALMENRNV